MRASFRYIINSLSGWGRLVIAMAIMVFFLPYALGHLGKYLYGVYAIVGSFMAVLRLVDGGMQASMMRFTAKAMSSDDKSQLLNVTSTGIAIQTTIGVVVILLAGLGVPFAMAFFDLPEKMTGDVLCLLLAMGLAFAFRQVSTVPLGIISGVNRQDIRNLIEVGSNLFRIFVLVVLFEVFGGSLKLLAVAILSWDASRILGGFLVARFAFNQKVFFRLSAVSKSTGKEVLGFTSLAFASTVGFMLTYQGQRFLVGKLLGPEWVTALAAPLTVSAQMGALVAGLAIPLTPMAATDAAKNQGKNMGQWATRISRFSMVLCLTIAIPLTIFSVPLLTFWLGEDLAWTWSLLVVCALCTVPRAAQTGNYFLCLGGKKIGRYALCSLTEGLIGVGASLLGYWFWNWTLFEIALAFMLPLAISGLWYWPRLVCRDFGMQRSRYYTEVFLRPLGSAIPPSLCGLAMMTFYPPFNLLMLIAEAGAAVLLTAVSAWFIALRGQDRNLIRGFLRKSLGKLLPSSQTEE